MLDCDLDHGARLDGIQEDGTPLKCRKSPFDEHALPVRMNDSLVLFSEVSQQKEVYLTLLLQ